MNYYDQIINKPGCACRPWPLMPASDADMALLDELEEGEE